MLTNRTMIKVYEYLLIPPTINSASLYNVKLVRFRKQNVVAVFSIKYNLESEPLGKSNETH